MDRQVFSTGSQPSPRLTWPAPSCAPESQCVALAEASFHGPLPTGASMWLILASFGALS
jgi:hypothetical protein